MKCQSCGNEAVIAATRGTTHTLREATGPEATVTLVLSRKNAIFTNVCDSCAAGLQKLGWVLPTARPRVKAPIQTVHVRLPESTIAKPVPRCTGCRWRIPIKLGGEGIRCLQKNGSCPEWAIKWALYYTKNNHGKPIKSFTCDEALLEALRL